MREWNFYFTDVDNRIRRQLEHSPDEWRSFGISYGRESKTTIVKSYSSGFTFIKEDAKWLRDIVFNRGFNQRIKFEVYAISANMKEVLEYTAYLDLTDPTISDSTFNCLLYEGGFFSSLDNNWDKEFEIKAFDKNSDFADEQDNLDFKDIDFTGGEYKYEENLGMLDETQEYGELELKFNELWHFLPIVKIFNNNSKLNFFNKSKFLKYAVGNVTKEQCFIISPDKLNGGQLILDFTNDFIDIEFIARNTRTGTNFSDIVTLINPKTGRYGNAYIETQIDYYIYNDIGLSNWNRDGSSGNLIYRDYLWVSNTRNMVAINEIGNNPLTTKMSVKSLNIGKSLIVDLSKHLEPLTDKNNGYMVAISLSINIFIDYFYSDGLLDKSININKDNTPDLTIIPHAGTFITYRNDKFMLNNNRTVHGIHPSRVFTSLIDKFNTTFKTMKTMPPQKVIIQKYNVNINTDALTNLQVFLASGTTLLGSKQDLIKSGIQASIITSLKDFCDAMYKVFALKLYCRYEKSNDTYYLTFLKVEDCYQNTLIHELTAVSDLEITADRENLYTAVKVGYNNSTDAIFGQLEYNTTNLFETENTERETNELDLVCGYKAGALDLETYVHEKYHNYEDTQEGSSDVWLLFAKYQFEAERGEFYTMEHASSTFSDKIKNAINILFTPKRILMRHRADLSSYSYIDKTLKFVSSERNADFGSGLLLSQRVVLTDEKEKDDFILPNVLAYSKPFILSVKVPAVKKLIDAIGKNPLGYFQFKYGNKTYRGYIADGTDSVQVNPMNESASEIKLIAHKDSEL